MHSSGAALPVPGRKLKFTWQAPKLGESTCRAGGRPVHAPGQRATLSTAMPTEFTRPSLDAAALERLQELDPDGRHGVLRRVLEAYETSLLRILEQLALEQTAGNPRTVSKLAHTLKSSSASVGALSLSQVCTEAEKRRRDGDAVGLDGDVARILAEGEAALVAVRAILRP